jgi:hypothetical protein
VVVWRHAVFSLLVVVGARRYGSSDLSPGWLPWRWSIWVAGFGKGLVNKRGSGLDLRRPPLLAAMVARGESLLQDLWCCGIKFVLRLAELLNSDHSSLLSVAAGASPR